MARKLAGSIYIITKSSPAEEKYSLISQMRRAAISVSSNIAGGTTRSTAKDQAHFMTIAFSSLMELFNHLIIASDPGYVREDEVGMYRQRIQLLSVKLSNLKASQVKRTIN